MNGNTLQHIHEVGGRINALHFAGHYQTLDNPHVLSPQFRPTKNPIFLLCKPFHKRKNWLFAGSLRSGQRGAAIMSLIRSAKINGHDPYAYLRDVLQRLPTQRASAINELLPHRWVDPGKV